MKNPKILQILGMAILVLSIFWARNGKSDVSHFLIASFGVILFWALHSIQFSISNIRTLLIILLVFAVPFFLIGQLSFFSSQSAVSGPWTGDSFNPSRIGHVVLSHEVALQLYFDHAPNDDERYFKTASLSQTNNGLNYQIQTLTLDETLMPDAKKWVNENLATKNLEQTRTSLQKWFQKDFHYSLEPGTLLEPHPLDEFLFRRKEGYCQHFAAALTTLLKLNGVRARVVVGFVGGSWNPFSRRLTYEMADSHAWVEAWDDSKNAWLKLDPTAWVSAQDHEDKSPLARFQPSFALSICLLFGVLLLIYTAIYTWKKKADPILTLFEKLEKFEKKYAFDAKGLTVEERIKRIAEKKPRKASRLMNALFLYQQIYFAGKATRELKKQLKLSLS